MNNSNLNLHHKRNPLCVINGPTGGGVIGHFEAAFGPKEVHFAWGSRVQRCKTTQRRLKATLLETGKGQSEKREQS